MDTQEMAAIRAERDRLKARQTIRNFGDDERWQRTKRKMARKYRVKKHGKVYWAIVKPWALLWYGIDVVRRKLSAI